MAGPHPSRIRPNRMTAPLRSGTAFASLHLRGAVHSSQPSNSKSETRIPKPERNPNPETLRKPEGLKPAKLLEDGPRFSLRACLTNPTEIRSLKFGVPASAGSTLAILRIVKCFKALVNGAVRPAEAGTPNAIFR